MQRPSDALDAKTIRTHDQWVRKLASQLVGEGPAPDVAQQVWIAALRCSPRRKGLRRWLATATRNASRMLRRGDTREELQALLTALPPKTAGDVIRAFSTYFQMINMAEKVHRIRRRISSWRSSMGDGQGLGTEAIS